MTLVCPSPDEIVTQALALLPRGRAWQTHEIGPRSGSVLYKFWRSVSDVSAFLGQRLCDLHREFFCATMRETRPEWLVEYGLPDDCDPFPDICAKVAATGGASCSYLTWLAEQAGWSISCETPCGGEAGCAEAGLAVAGQSHPNGTLIITVHISESPAFVPVEGAAEAGCLESGQAIWCDPIEPLRCMLSRVLHAHLAVFFYIEA